MVETVPADGLAEAQLVLVVHLSAREADAMLANWCIPPRPAAPRLAIRAEWPCVHGSKARRGQRDEQRRVLDHGLGDALAAAETGRNQLVGVSAVALRTWRAHGLATVPARLSENAVRLGVG